MAVSKATIKKTYQELSPEEKTLVLAEANKFKAEERLLAIRADAASDEAAMTRMNRENAERQHSVLRNMDEWYRVYDFDEVVRKGEVEACIKTLSVWQRQNDNPILIRFNSPGGSVIDGFALYDYLRSIAARDKDGNLLGPNADPSTKVKGVYVTTMAWGMAASMAGVLLQAGNRRVLTPNGWVLVHPIRTGMFGGFSLGEIDDEKRLLDKLQERLYQVLTERSTVSREQLAQMSNRKDYWIDAEETLSHGLIDAIGYE